MFIAFIYTLCLAGQDYQLRHYLTQEMMRSDRAVYPSIATNAFALEGVVEKFKNNVYSTNAPPEKVHLQLVFHLIQSQGYDPVTYQDVVDQVEALNRDFGEAGLENALTDSVTEFSGRIAPVDLHFCLAETERGTMIVEIATDSSAWEATDERFKFTASGGDNAYDPQHYINVWVVHLKNDISGYAKLPGTLPEIDGIVIDPDFFGNKDAGITPYGESKTLTHLVGSYLGLYELWNEWIPCGDDFVEDTPLHNSPNYAVPNVSHLSFCDNNPVEMTMNFMDNTDDSGLYMFTEGQKIRMLAMIYEGGPRHDLRGIGSSCDNSLLPEASASHSPAAANAAAYQGITTTAVPSIVNDVVIGIDVQPNPVITHTIQLFLVKSSGDIGWLKVFDMTGSLRYERKVDNSTDQLKVEVNADAWPSGTYIATWQTETDRRSCLISLVK